MNAINGALKPPTIPLSPRHPLPIKSRTPFLSSSPSSSLPSPYPSSPLSLTLLARPHRRRSSSTPSPSSPLSVELAGVRAHRPRPPVEPPIPLPTRPTTPPRRAPSLHVMNPRLKTTQNIDLFSKSCFKLIYGSCELLL
jgi:hypothetical protein